MKSPPRSTRTYDSGRRLEAASATRGRILNAASELFSRKGTDAVAINDVAAAANVSVSTIYGVFKSKEGLLRALIERTLFGVDYQAAAARLGEEADPVQQVLRTALVARSIYEAEAAQLGIMRAISGFSPDLRKLEQKFEELRYDLQRERLERLFASGKARAGLTLDDARRILWMYTSRDVYRLLVEEGRWTPEHYEEWLEQTLLEALVTRQS